MGAVTHYTAADRAAISQIFALVPGALPVACRGSEFDCAPGEWPDHAQAKSPYLHATGKEYSWKNRRLAAAVKESIALVLLVVMAFPRSGLFGLDNDGAALGASPLGGGALVPSRGSHEHFLHRKGTGRFTDSVWEHAGGCGVRRREATAERNAEIHGLHAAGESNKAIALAMGLTPKAVRHILRRGERTYQ